MDDAEELADIVRAVDRTEVEEFLTVGQIDAAVLHRTGVAAAGGIRGDGVGVQDIVGRMLGRGGSRRAFRAMDIRSGAHGIGVVGLLTALESLEASTFHPLHLPLTLLPRGEHPRVQPVPNDVKLLLCHDRLYYAY